MLPAGNQRHIVSAGRAQKSAAAAAVHVVQPIAIHTSLTSSSSSSSSSSLPTRRQFTASTCILYSALDDNVCARHVRRSYFVPKRAPSNFPTFTTPQASFCLVLCVVMKFVDLNVFTTHYSVQIYRNKTKPSKRSNNYYEFIFLQSITLPRRRFSSPQPRTTSSVQLCPAFQLC